MTEEFLAADGVCAEPYGLVIRHVGDVVVVAFEGARRSAEPLGELVQLGEGDVADQMGP